MIRSSFRFFKCFFCCTIIAIVVVACGKNQSKPLVTRGCIDEMAVRQFALSETKIRGYINDLMYADGAMQVADTRIKDYYKENGPFLWISRFGLSHNADSVLKYVARVSDLGFSPSKFKLDEIERDKRLADSLDFEAENINKVFARLEYNLTKAYLQYVVGQRFGYVNPRKLLNRLDVRDSDSVRVTYQELFDLPIKKVTFAFVQQAFNKIRHDSVGVFLRESEPKDGFYNSLLTELHRTEERSAARMRILCNMERCRWAVNDRMENHKKYVLLNIPSQELEAIDGDERLSMRVVCGSKKTKTPLLQSYIQRIDINPQWIIPRSIIDKSVSRHAGNAYYFESNNYFIRERKTGKTVNPALVTSQMLKSNEYLVIQKGGKGNALGRIIFRFNNKFSVFLHDTSNPSLFASVDRLASHGCVRVQKPFELATFLLSDKDEDLISKIQYSIGIEGDGGVNDENSGGEESKIDKSRIVRSIVLKPHIPLYITYFTLMPSASGQLVAYPDIYGYDGVIANALNKYI